MDRCFLSGLEWEMIAERGVLSCVKCLGVNRLAGWYLHRRLTNKQNKRSGKSLVSFSYAGSWFTAPGLKKQFCAGDLFQIIVTNSRCLVKSEWMHGEIWSSNVMSLVLPPHPVMILCCDPPPSWHHSDHSMVTRGQRSWTCQWLLCEQMSTWVSHQTRGRNFSPLTLTVAA